MAVALPAARPSSRWHRSVAACLAADPHPTAARRALCSPSCLPGEQQSGPSSAPVAIWGRRNDARADRNVRLQPITSISPPMFNFEHRLISWSRYPNQEVACLKGTTVVNFCEVVNIDQHLGQRGWKLVGITARQRHLSVTGSVVLPP